MTTLAELENLRSIAKQLVASVDLAIENLHAKEQGVDKEPGEWLDWNLETARKLKKGYRVVFSQDSKSTLENVGWLSSRSVDAEFKVSHIDDADDRQPIRFETVGGLRVHDWCWPATDLPIKIAIVGK
ncbi:hypothetical protein QE320_gp102 [Pseudomonas phage EM]|uniref:Uncharacterized protein n=1 Tax=Pseudomonas phage EM TaxID=2936914 RepID=A0AAE9HM00_9CAUD|nr:hypothetical protein QE320_gp102 [Pseudomonas phage EM]UPW35952.1 hypothetical protein EM_167 [Pseudomonas phage EM]